MDKPMTLLELCEPLFQYMCKLNRIARKGGGDRYSVGQVRSQVEAILAQCEGKSVSAPGLRQQYELIEPVLKYFVDYMIAESSLPFAHQWEEIAQKEGDGLAGDEKFFVLLEETLRDRSNEATDRLGVFYTCVGLGFQGVHTGQPEQLRRLMKECQTRIRKQMEAGLNAARVCPEAYEHTDTSNLIEPPGKWLVVLGIVLVGMLVTLALGNAYLFQLAVGELRDALNALRAGPSV